MTTDEFRERLRTLIAEAEGVSLDDVIDRAQNARIDDIVDVLEEIVEELDAKSRRSPSP